MKNIQNKYLIDFLENLLQIARKIKRNLRRNFKVNVQGITFDEFKKKKKKKINNCVKNLKQIHENRIASKTVKFKKNSFLEIL